MPCDKYMYGQLDEFLWQQQIHDSQTLKGYIHDGVAILSSFAFDKRESSSLGISLRSLGIRADVDMVLLKR